MTSVADIVEEYLTPYEMGGGVFEQVASKLCMVVKPKDIKGQPCSFVTLWLE